MTKSFEVQIYYSGFCSYQIKAKTEAEAIQKARELPIDKNQIFSNLENWQEADTVEEIENNFNL